MNWIIDNWAVIIALLCMVCCVAESVLTFIKEPKDKRIANVKQWLLWAVTEAERLLGDKTGALKLRYVWNLACQTFSWLPKIVTFETFSEWVDQALEWLKAQLESNQAVKDYVEGTNNE